MKRTKRSAAPANVADGAAGVGAAPETVVPVAADGFDDDILGEIVGPSKPAATAAIDDLPDERESDEFQEDILGALSDPPDAAGEGLDDLFDDLAAPSAPVLSAGLPEGPDQAPGQPAFNPLEAPASHEVSAAAGSAGETTPEMVPAVVKSGDPGSGKPSFAAKLRKLAGGGVPRFAGTREISRKAYAGGLGMIGVLTLVSVGQAAIILTHSAPAAGQAHGNPAPAAAPAVLPINYARVDLERFIDKTRSLPEGGRQILRNPAVKEAIVELGSGEQLYQQLKSMAARSATADRVTIRNNRVRITSCNAPACGDKAFQLTYDIGKKRAVACVTEKYLNGSFLSYRYDQSGYGEVPHCG